MSSLLSPAPQPQVAGSRELDLSSQGLIKRDAFVSCALEEHEKKAVNEALAEFYSGVSQHTGVPQFIELQKRYIRSLELLYPVLAPVRTGHFSSLYIEGLPADELASHGRRVLSFHTEMNICGMMRAGGFQFAPHEEIRSYEQSRVLRDLETHLADFLLPNPHAYPFSVLSCLKNEREKTIRLIEIDELVEALDEEDRETLRQRLFSKQEPNHGAWSQPVPALSIENQRWEFALSTYSLRGLNSSAQRVLTKVQELLNSPSLGREIALKSSDALIINNHRCLHGSQSRESIGDLWIKYTHLTISEKAHQASNQSRLSVIH